jgi:hypothetical protein
MKMQIVGLSVLIGILAFTSGCVAKRPEAPVLYETRIRSVEGPTFVVLERRIEQAVAAIDEEGGEVLSLSIATTRGEGTSRTMHHGLIVYRELKPGNTE